MSTIKNYITFKDKSTDEEYLNWVVNNQNGFVVNIDAPNSFKQYPMVHKATHKTMSTTSRSNYTTGKYFKVCALALEDLEKWSIETYGKKLTKCKSCM